MILAPVYRIFGVDLRAFKIATVLCFIGFLAVFARIDARRDWLVRHGDLVGSGEFQSRCFGDSATLFFRSFRICSFLLRRCWRSSVFTSALAEINSRLGNALLVSALLYCAYGTRTIGIALVFALIAADLAKFRRPSRFLFCVLALTGLFIGAQTLLLTSPKGYVSAFHFSLHTVAANIVYYGKTLSYVWAERIQQRTSDRFRAAVYGGGGLGISKEPVARTMA